jgi:CDP-4-dehydro-6-deoxyglucose reductase
MPFDHQPDAAPAAREPGPLTLSVETARGVRAIQADVGETLLGALRAAAAPIRSICGGQASCGACRVVATEAWRSRLAPPGRVEARLLAHLEEAGPDDRLACQLILSADLDGLAVRVCPLKPAIRPA